MAESVDIRVSRCPLVEGLIGKVVIIGKVEELKESMGVFSEILVESYRTLLLLLRRLGFQQGLRVPFNVIEGMWSRMVQTTLNPP